MHELIVISGKGGTGKTSLMAAFASLAENKVLCDADVDAADLHLILAPDIRKREPFTSGHTAVIEKKRCTECGLCRELCRWDAIGEDFAVDAVTCEGCGVCVHFCPEKAIDFPENTCGEWFVSETRFGPMVHARLGIAEENSGKLVALVRQEARKLAEARGMNLILTDGPPGVGCPVIASMGGASGVLIVAEPSVSGVHDMERVAQLAAHFNVPAMVCVNKFDINTEKSRLIEEFAGRRGMAFLGRVPFDPAFTRAMVQGRTIFEYDGHSDARPAVVGVWNSLRSRLAKAA
ncbi:MAG: (4Fe-4S)-binding protein [Desulfobacterales bacterium]